MEVTQSVPTCTWVYKRKTKEFPRGYKCVEPTLDGKPFCRRHHLSAKDMVFKGKIVIDQGGPETTPNYRYFSYNENGLYDNATHPKYPDGQIRVLFQGKNENSDISQQPQ